MREEQHLVPTDYYSLSIDGKSLTLIYCNFTNEPRSDVDYHYFVSEDGTYTMLEFDDVVEFHIFLEYTYPDKKFDINFDGTKDKVVTRFIFEEGDDDDIPF
jgi:hypothetical protein